MDDLRIGEVSRRAGVTVRTLRYYEELGLLSPERSGSGRSVAMAPRCSTGSTGCGCSASSARRWPRSSPTPTTCSASPSGTSRPSTNGSPSWPGCANGSGPSRPACSAATHRVFAGDGVIQLHQESVDFRLVSPATLGGASHCMAVHVDDVDAHHERVRDAGGAIVYAPTDMPYGVREYAVRDNEDGLWSLMQTLSETNEEESDE